MKNPCEESGRWVMKHMNRKGTASSITVKLKDGLESAEEFNDNLPEDHFKAEDDACDAREHAAGKSPGETSKDRQKQKNKYFV